MNVKFILSKIRRKFPSRIKLSDVLRKVELLEFENETILTFLEKYNIIMTNQGPRNQKSLTIQEYVRTENESGIEITVLEI
jgi:hypothetical protein